MFTLLGFILMVFNISCTYIGLVWVIQGLDIKLFDIIWGSKDIFCVGFCVLMHSDVACMIIWSFGVLWDLMMLVDCSLQIFEVLGYIYVYMSICVCVCECVFFQGWMYDNMEFLG